MAYASDQLSAGAFISAAPRQHRRQGRSSEFDFEFVSGLVMAARVVT